MPDSATGSAREIRTLGDPVLRSAARTVTDFGPDLQRLVEDMFASMYAANGVGLAANQIGVDLDVFVYDCPLDDEDEDEPEDPEWPPAHGKGVVVNGRLVATWGEDEVVGEGCLSLPGYHWDTPRPVCARVEGQDRTGAPTVVEGSGQLARCLQHETDHLRGLVYLDTLPRKERGKALRGYLKLADS